MQCPRCGSKDIKRVRRRLWMRLIRVRARYKCGQCERDFMVFRDVPRSTKMQAPR